MPADTSSEAVFAAKLADPSFPDEHWELYRSLTDMIMLDSNPFENNPLSPTPGDPATVIMSNNKSYETGALEFMKSKLDDISVYSSQNFNDETKKPLFSNEVYAVLLNEIKIQHRIEIAKNNDSFGRLLNKFRNDQDSIDPSQSDQIERIRGVSASTFDRMTFIISHPEIDAIEDAKMTCPLDYRAYIDAKSNYFSRLFESIVDSDRFVTVMIASDDQKPRMRKLDKSVSAAVVSKKIVIAEIFDSETGQVIEVVEKLNQYAFPADYKLPGILPRLVNAENFEELSFDEIESASLYSFKNVKNLQPVYMQICLRIKKDRISEKEGVMTEAQYDASRLHIIENGIKRHIKNVGTYSR